MKLLIIPDIHGRDFWKEPCQHIDEFDKVVCLGDYHDPYPQQVSQDISRHMLRDEFVPFVEKHKDKFVCLFGNHDGNYIVGDMANRIDFHHKEEIRNLLKRLDLQLIYEVDGYLFSHSGVLPSWMSNNFSILDEHEVVDCLKNVQFWDPALLDVSPYRGGYSRCGSCIWGDVREYSDAYQYIKWYQIFGHTQLQNEIITDTFACLDCRKAFVLNTETKELKEYGKESI